jgi:hypothetical protein
MVELGDYPAVLARNLNSCVREPSAFLAVLVVQLDGGARLDFVQVRGGGRGAAAATGPALSLLPGGEARRRPSPLTAPFAARA